MKKLNEQEKVELGITSNAMAVREYLMEYFKGTSVHNLTEGTIIYWDTISYDDEESHRYRHREHELQAPRRLWLNNAPILEVQLHPKVATLYTGVLNRSEEYSKIHEHLTKFFTRFLGSVELKENRTFGSRHLDGNNDRQLMIAIASRYIRDQQDAPREEPTDELAEFPVSPFGQVYPDVVATPSYWQQHVVSQGFMTMEEIRRHMQS